MFTAGLTSLRQGYGGPPKLYAKAEGLRHVLLNRCRRIMAPEPPGTESGMPTNDETVTQVPPPPGPLTVKAYGITDKGRVRPSNEDQFLIAELTKAMRIWQTSLQEPQAQFGDERGHLFLVADGMGGHQGGEHASALAVLAIEQFTLNTLKWFFDPKRAGSAARPRAFPERRSARPTTGSSKKRRSIRN